MKKLWVVLYEAENVVYAESQEAAEKISERFRRDAELEHARTYEMGKCLPYGWEGSCIPYGEDELTIDEILAGPSESKAEGEP